jgi:hypothetical protein
MKPLRILAIATAIMAASAALAISPEARGSAMGEAYSPFAEGGEGMWWNPAVLGSPVLGSVSLGGSVAVGNNALTLSRMMGIVQDNDTEKRSAIEDVRKTSEKVWNASGEAALGGAVTVMGVGVGVYPQVRLEARDITPDAMEFALFDQKLDPNRTSYDLSGELCRATWMEVGLGYGREVFDMIPGLKISAGAQVKLLKGVDFEVASTKQKFNKNDPLSAESTAYHFKSTDGSGFAADAGIHAKILGIVDGSVVLKNLGGKIKWKGDAESGALDQSTLSFNKTVAKDQEVEMELPKVVMAGVGAHIPVVGTAAGVEAEMNTTDSETRMHIGAEQSMFGILSLRAGYQTKSGGMPPMVTFGAGVGILVARLDVGGGLAPGGKGGMASVSGLVSF